MMMSQHTLFLLKEPSLHVLDLLGSKPCNREPLPPGCLRGQAWLCCGADAHTNVHLGIQSLPTASAVWLLLQGQGQHKLQSSCQATWLFAQSISLPTL